MKDEEFSVAIDWTDNNVGIYHPFIVDGRRLTWHYAEEAYPRNSQLLANLHTRMGAHDAAFPFDNSHEVIMRGLDNCLELRVARSYFHL